MSFKPCSLCSEGIFCELHATGFQRIGEWFRRKRADINWRERASGLLTILLMAESAVAYWNVITVIELLLASRDGSHPFPLFILANLVLVFSILFLLLLTVFLYNAVYEPLKDWIEKELKP